MAVLRQQNWLGQQRVDVPHLRSLESAVAADFDLFAGSIFAGKRTLVIKGFEILTPELAIGTEAASLQLQVGGGIMIHPLASEAGSIFTVDDGFGAEVLSQTNPNVQGSFTAGQVNYIGLDLVRRADATTTDLVTFLDANTLQETSKAVPLARTLQHKILIGTTPFESTPDILPVAKVTTDAVNIVTAVEDCRRMAFSLRTGGSSPDQNHIHTWTQGRNENLQDAAGQVFSGGDKTVGSFKDWMDAVMTRLWETGGGEHWYSASNDRNINLIWTGAPFANGENFDWNSGTGTLQWKGLRFLFDNSTAWYNDIQDGSITLADGEVLYVDLTRSTNATGGGARVPAKAALTALGPGTLPGTRIALAWRSGTKVYTRNWRYPVGQTFVTATATSLGMVQLNATPVSSTNPVVTTIDSIGRVLATGLSRAGLGIGYQPLGIGTHAMDGDVIVGNTTKSLLLDALLDGHASALKVGTTANTTDLKLGFAALATVSLDGTTISIGTAGAGGTPVINIGRAATVVTSKGKLVGELGVEVPVAQDFTYGTARTDHVYCDATSGVFRSSTASFGSDGYPTGNPTNVERFFLRPSVPAGSTLLGDGADTLSFIYNPVLGGYQVYDVLMVSATDGWAVGAGNRIYRYDGTIWKQQTTGLSHDSSQTWRGVARDALTGHVWVVGDNSKAIRFDGTTWSAVGIPGGGSGSYRCVAAHSGNVYIGASASGLTLVGAPVLGDPLLVKTWTGATAVNRIRRLNDGTIVAVGNSGKFASYDGFGWVDYAWTGSTSAHLRDVAGESPTNMAIFGDSAGSGGLFGYWDPTLNSGSGGYNPDAYFFAGSFRGACRVNSTTILICDAGGNVFKYVNTGGSVAITTLRTFNSTTVYGDAFGSWSFDAGDGFQAIGGVSETDYWVADNNSYLCRSGVSDPVVLGATLNYSLMMRRATDTDVDLMTGSIVLPDLPPSPKRKIGIPIPGNQVLSGDTLSLKVELAGQPAQPSGAPTLRFLGARLRFTHSKVARAI